MRTSCIQTCISNYFVCKEFSIQPPPPPVATGIWKSNNNRARQDLSFTAYVLLAIFVRLVHTNPKLAILRCFAEGCISQLLIALFVMTRNASHLRSSFLYLFYTILHQFYLLGNTSRYKFQGFLTNQIFCMIFHFNQL